MKKFYFILPIIGVVIFAFFYMGVKNDIKLKEEKRKQDQIKEQNIRAEKDVEARKAAFAIASADVQRRIEAAAEKKRIEDEQAAEVQAAKDARDLAYRERERQNKRYQELTKERVIANEQLALIREQLELQKIQADYLKQAVTQVSANRASYEQILTKLELVEKAVAVQEANARAVKKN